MGETRGRISFFATYRPPVALDIYTTSYPNTNNNNDEIRILDKGNNYNYNGHQIPPSSLKKMLKHRSLSQYGTQDDVDAGELTGVLFVSERTEGLETLHIAILRPTEDVVVLNFAKVYGTFSGARLEDSGCFGGGDGEYIVYVSTKDDPQEFHQPWTAVFRTHLVTGETVRLTPFGTADLNPTVSPDGRTVAVATFEGKDGGWCGEIEDLQTSIITFDLENYKKRQVIVKDGGWPTWGSNNHLFFHRNTEKVEMVKKWKVYRVDINIGENSVTQVTPSNISAITPSAINETTVVVATIRQVSGFGVPRSRDQYRHVEVFELSRSGPQEPKERVTVGIRELADHFNPFVIKDASNDVRIGYHRCKVTDKIDEFAVVETKFHEIKSPDEKIGVFRVSGVFPTFSPDGTKLAFVDNEFKSVWVADSDGLRAIYETGEANALFSPVWNKNPDLDTLYVCQGPSFSATKEVHIVSIYAAAEGKQLDCELTQAHNNAFPSTNSEGTKLVYRSTRDGPKNLYIMQDAKEGEWGAGEIERITNGPWTDTHCQWCPGRDWIAFSSNRSNPTAVKQQDMPDPGFFGVYLVNVATKTYPVVKVIDSGFDYTGGNLFAGHVNHPFFSPDGKSLVVAADLAAVSCDPISLPLFSHSVRPYGDIFIVDLDVDDMKKNENLKTFRRVTHSKYENSTATWIDPPNEIAAANWNGFLGNTTPGCPFLDQGNGGESFITTGHLYLPRRCC